MRPIRFIRCFDCGSMQRHYARGMCRRCYKRWHARKSYDIPEKRWKV